METNENPVISIVIPVHDRQELVLRTLESVAAQSFRNVNIILVDNASTDNTLKVITRWADEHRNDFAGVTVLSCDRIGAAAARNCGLKAVTTQFVMFFDSDDVMLPDHLARINEALSANPDTTILRWNIGIIDADGWLDTKRQHDENELRLHIQHTSLSTQRYIVNTEFLRSAGAWDESLSVWIDYELGARLLLLGARVKVLHGEPRVIVYPTDISITGRDYSSRAQGHRKAFDKIRALMSGDTHRHNRILLAAKETAMAAIYRREGDHASAALSRSRARNGLKLHHRLRLHCIYAVTLLFGTGGSTLANMLFQKRIPKKERK